MLYALKEAREVYTNFIGGSVNVAAEPGVITATGTGAAAVLVPSQYPSNVGIAQLQSGTLATNTVVWATDTGLFQLGQAPHRYRAVFQMPVVASTYTLAFGFTAGPITAITDGAWFSINAAGALQINYLDNSVGATGISVAAAVPALVANTWYQAVIDVNVPIINSNQPTSPNLGGPTTGARFYFGPLVPVATTGTFPSTNRVLGDVPLSKLPGFSDSRTVGATFAILNTSTTSLNVNVDSIYASDGLMGFV